MSIKAELAKATGVKQKPKEDDEDYRTRVAKACDDLADDDFDAMSAEAQDWANSALKTLNAQKGKGPVPEFPDDEGGDQGEESETGDEAENKQEEEVATAKKGAAAKKSTAKTASKTTAKTASKTTTKKKDDEETKKPAAKADPKKDETKKPAAKAKANGKGGDEDKGVKWRLKELMLDDPTMPSSELHTKLKKDGYDTTIATVTSIRSEFRHSLRVMQEAGIAGVKSLKL